MVLDLVLVAVGAYVVCALPRSGRPSIIPPASILMICAGAALFVFVISDPQPMFWDFRQAYYRAGKAVLESPSALGPVIEDTLSGFVNLPIVAYLFAPFAALNSWWGAPGLFSLIGLAAIGATWLLLVHMTGLEGWRRWLLLFLFAASGPLHYSLKEGNTSHFVLLALVAGLYLLHAGRDAAAGVVLALGALIKPPLLLFGVYFLLRRHWAAVLSFGGLLAFAGLLSLAVFGLEFNLRWFELCVLQVSSEPVGAFNDQSVRGFLARLFEGPEILLDWKLHPATPVQRLLGSGLNALIYLAVIAVCIRRWLADRNSANPKAASAQSGDLEYLLIVALVIATSPLSWTHYYCWLLMPIAFYLSPRSPFPSGRTAQWLAVAGTLIIMPAVLYTFNANAGAVTIYAKFAVSHYLFGDLIWMSLIIWALASSHSAERAGTVGERGRVLLPLRDAPVAAGIEKA